jgi:cation diffusion facilitator CzcD-associated flavoprotein CzcO
MRTRLYWLFEARALGFVVNPGLMKLVERKARAHLADQVSDPTLRAALTPDYVIGCKRVLISDDYYPALCRPEVTLHPGSPRAITPTGFVTAEGIEHEVDAIVLGTGFRTDGALVGARVVGRDGRLLDEVWKFGPEAHHGITTAGFPNLFFLLGPNTGLGHNSVVLMAEAQMKYVLAALDELDRRHVRTMEVRRDRQWDSNVALRERMGRTVWQTGCRSWYLDADGVNRNLWPDFTWRYFRTVARLDPSDFVFRV